MAAFLIRRGSTRRIVYAGPMLMAASALNRVHALQAQNTQLQRELAALRDNLAAEREAYNAFRDAVEGRRGAEEDLVDHYRAVAEWARVRNEPRVLH